MTPEADLQSLHIFAHAHPPTHNQEGNYKSHKTDKWRMVTDDRQLSQIKVSHHKAEASGPFRAVGRQVWRKLEASMFLKWGHCHLVFLA